MSLQASRMSGLRRTHMQMVQRKAHHPTSFLTPDPAMWPIQPPRKAPTSMDFLSRPRLRREEDGFSRAPPPPPSPAFLFRFVFLRAWGMSRRVPQLTGLRYKPVTHTQNTGTQNVLRDHCVRHTAALLFTLSVTVTGITSSSESLAANPWWLLLPPASFLRRLYSPWYSANAITANPMADQMSIAAGEARVVQLDMGMSLSSVRMNAMPVIWPVRRSRLEPVSSGMGYVSLGRTHPPAIKGKERHTWSTR